MIFICNPLDTLKGVIESMFPDRVLHVHFTLFDEGGEEKGLTVFPEEGGTPDIFINVDQPMFGVIDTIAHEVSHVVCGINEQHGEEWGRVYGQIVDAFNEEVSRISMEMGVSCEDRYLDDDGNTIRVDSAE